MLPAQTAFVFPGQGSQVVGMGSDLAAEIPLARQIFAQADEALEFPLSRLAWEGPEAELNDTINTQPALLVHSIAVMSIFQQRYPGFQPAFAAGHSMGELSALVACQALSYSEALKLARRRGELMKKAGDVSPGGMAAVLGLDIPTLDRVCAEASQPGETVQVANDNCPGQVVISGAKPALERAIQLAQEKGARRVRQLAVSIASHSPHMLHAQGDFAQAVELAPFSDPQLPLVGNVTALPLLTASEIRLDLQAQLTSRVRWTETIQEMARRGVTLFVEMGSGSVLSGLIKRIDEQVTCINLSTIKDFDKLEMI